VPEIPLVCAFVISARKASMSERVGSISVLLRAVGSFFDTTVSGPVLRL